MSVSYMSKDMAQVVALIQKIDADAYKRGCDETLARILSAAQAEPAVTQVDRARSPESVRDTLPIKIDYSGNTEGTKKRAAKGSVPHYVNQVLTAPGYAGMDYRAIGQRVHELGGTLIALASIRNYLRNLEVHGLANRQNEIWYPSASLRQQVHDQIASLLRSIPDTLEKDD
jgi:hypothetical protein